MTSASTLTPKAPRTMADTIRVRAVGTGKLPFPGITGRFVGRDPARDHAIIPEGVDVPDDSYHRRAIKSGDLALLVVAAPDAEVSP